MKSTLLGERDLAAQRRQALAKVYRLLLNLAEEAEMKSTVIACTASNEDKTKEAALAIENLSIQQIV